MNSRSRAGFYTIWTLVLLLSVILALFALFFVSCTKSPASAKETAEATQQAESGTSGEPAATAVPAATDVPAETTPPVVTTLAQTEDQGASYLDSFVFLGDSTTYGLAANGVLPKTQVWTPESGTLTLSNQSIATVVVYSEDGSTQNLLIADAAAAVKPAYLVITLGINGISFMSEDEFKTQYIALINAIQTASPDTKIICQSIFPVVDSQVADGISNSAVNTANLWIMDIAAQTGTRYLNTHDALMDDTANLNPEYSNGDGIHLNAAGGGVVLLSVRTHAYA